ncbi:hypothetical protein FN846DRAFT_529439 [Sphaerosporella brunnea]|uniref:Secreted protein n=1 Tax=Sphaerosporella brunnea TaxID=1250544 RepID=A0A5J5EDQ2_9PEZI|nr:hypothetical protein FN846DRAFT_529439 [Sphaerosporella brunnea]
MWKPNPFNAFLLAILQLRQTMMFPYFFSQPPSLVPEFVQTQCNLAVFVYVSVFRELQRALCGGRSRAIAATQDAQTTRSSLLAPRPLYPSRSVQPGHESRDSGGKTVRGRGFRIMGTAQGELL